VRIRHFAPAIINTEKAREELDNADLKMVVALYHGAHARPNDYETSQAKEILKDWPRELWDQVPNPVIKKRKAVRHDYYMLN